MKPEAFRRCFHDGVRHALPGDDTGPNRRVAIDGKTCRGSHDARKNLGALHLVSAWASEEGIALGQGAAADKSNEITAIPLSLQPIDLSETIEYDVTCVAFSPDGKRIVTGDGENNLKVWDARNGDELLNLEGHEAVVTSVAFSSDGKRIVSGSRDETLRVWDANNGKELLTLRGHKEEVTSVAFSPDGKRIVSGSEDHTLRIWEAQSGKEWRSLRGHEHNVTSVAFSPDGKRLVSGSKGTLKVWECAK